MKKIISIVFICALMGCKKEAATSNYAIISGKITNSLSKTITLNNFEGSKKKEILISENGTFTDTINTQSNTAILFDGKNPIFLFIEPGYHIQINYDASNFENTLSFSGNGAIANNYLLVKKKEVAAYNQQARQSLIKNEGDFKLDLQNTIENIENLLTKTKNLPSGFIEKEKKSIHYFYLNKLKEYETAQNQFAQRQAKPATLSNSFLKELKDIDYNNEEDFNFSDDYKILVFGHYSTLANKRSQETGTPYEISFLNTVGNIKSETIKNALLFGFSNHYLPRSKDVKTFYNTFIKYSSNTQNNAEITKIYKEFTALDKGQPSPKFTNYRNYHGGTTSLDDLKGKYVYIDVWATWCRPCLSQIPALKALEKKYHDKNIEFVSISIDKPNALEKWKAMVKEQQLGGIQLFAGSDWNTPFVKAYKIQGIPRFILIDPEGNIVNSNAPRPGDPSIMSLFSELGI